MSESNKGSDWAFPLGANEWAGHGPVRGMTLRDYFAAKAMHGFLSGPMNRVDAESDADVARISYVMADAMLAERAK